MVVCYYFNDRYFNLSGDLSSGELMLYIALIINISKYCYREINWVRRAAKREKNDSGLEEGSFLLSCHL